MKKMFKCKKQSGFTLLEIVVALAVLTIALTAIVSVGSRRAETLLNLREKSRALIVANNILQLYTSNTQPVTVGLIDGVQENGNTAWKWQLNVQPSSNEYIYRLDVRVSKDANFDYAQASLVGFRWH